MSVPTKTERPDIHFRISAKDYRHLQGVAKAMDRSVSYLIEKIVKEWIEQQSQPHKE